MNQHLAWAVLLTVLCCSLLFALLRLDLLKWNQTGSRYVSWLPSFSVEVTRVRMEPLAVSQIEAMVRQVQAMFPQYPSGVLAAELQHTRSAALTIDNILEGRLPPPAPRPEPAAASAASAAPAPGPRQPPAPACARADDIVELRSSSAAFPPEAGAREASLRRRKDQLVAAARQRYLARAPAHAHAPAPAPATPRS